MTIAEKLLNSSIKEIYENAREYKIVNDDTTMLKYNDESIIKLARKRNQANYIMDVFRLDPWKARRIVMHSDQVDEIFNENDRRVYVYLDNSVISFDAKHVESPFYVYNSKEAYQASI